MADQAVQAHVRFRARISIPQDAGKTRRQQAVASCDFPMGRAHREASRESTATILMSATGDHVSILGRPASPASAGHRNTGDCGRTPITYPSGVTARRSSEYPSTPPRALSRSEATAPRSIWH